MQAPAPAIYAGRAIAVVALLLTSLSWFAFVFVNRTPNGLAAALMLTIVSALMLGGASLYATIAEGA